MTTISLRTPGLLLPATLAEHLGLKGLLDRHVELGKAPGRANPGHKAMTLLHSALAGGDCIDDAAVLGAGGTEDILGHELRAPSTLGTFLRSFTFGDAGQLDEVSRERLHRAWTAGAGPGEAPLVIDIDSTICETYGLQKEGGSRFTYTHVRGYHPLLAVAQSSGEVPHSRLRGGPSHTGRGSDELPHRVLFPGEGGRRHRAHHRAGGLRVLHPPRHECLRAGRGYLLHHRQDASQPAHTHRCHPRGRLGPDPLLPGGGCRRRDHLHAVRRQDQEPEAGPPDRSPGPADPRIPARPVLRVSPTTASSPTERGRPWTWRPTTGPTPRSRTPSGT